MKRVLVIRGGAIGDFILTLPALKAFREAHPETELEILGYTHIAELARDRFYAKAVRSIEYGALARFFARNAELPDDLADYFSRFDVIVSYLFDPDGIFETNLRRSGVEEVVRGPGKLDHETHAARQLAEPMEQFGVEVTDYAAKFYQSLEDHEFGREFLKEMAAPVVAFHPGSGSEKKNWPVEKWIELGEALLADKNFTGSILIVSGEADERAIEPIRRALEKNRRVRFVHALPLPQLGAVLSGTVFIGHDSGISHLAAAAGARCVLLFGPTNPDVWAPIGENVTIVRARNRELASISSEQVLDVLKASSGSGRAGC